METRIIRLLQNIVLLSIALFVAGCSKERNSTVCELKLAHGLPTDHPVHKGIAKMADEVRRISGGDMEIKVYPGGQLGSEQDCIEMLQLGALAMTKVSSATMEGFCDDYKVLGLPYIFRNKQHVFSVLDGDIGEQILMSPQEKELVGLCFYDAGSRSFYTRDKQVRTPDDVKGMKIRVMKSPIAVGMIKSMGGVPTPMDYGELYTALQNGGIDGAENNPPSLYTSHHYEVCKYYTLDEHSTVPDVLIISRHVWAKLSSQEQKWLKEAAKYSVPFQRQYWKEDEEKCLNELRAAGVNVLELSDDEKKAFADITRSNIENAKDNALLKDYIERIEAK
ncbi:MAG: TRAP transporter substrate-binding protein [Bacteroidales bacterium]